MQAPVGDAGDDRLARQLRAMQEEQQRDRDVRDDREDMCGFAATRQQARDDHGHDQGDREAVEQQHQHLFHGLVHPGNRFGAILPEVS